MRDEAVTIESQEAAEPPPEELLTVSGLRKYFPVRRGLLQRQVAAVQAVDGLDFGVRSGETLSLVGESGCGKTTIGRLIVGLEKATAGMISFGTVDLAEVSGREYRRLRRKIQYMFQDSYASLDPRMRVGSILREPLVVQHTGSRQEQERRVAEMLDHVGLPGSAVERYPHEFSGGQRQRLGFARALMLRPELIVADEPVSALDVSIQAQIIALLKRLARERGTAVLLITHDMGVIAETAQRVAVMYAGRIVEIGPTARVLGQPVHPYTRGLIGAVPSPDRAEALAGIDGQQPRPGRRGPGCSFAARSSSACSGRLSIMVSSTRFRRASAPSGLV